MKEKIVWVVTSLSFCLYFSQSLFASTLPLLTRLFINEFGFVLCLVGIYNGVTRMQQEDTPKLIYLAGGICMLLSIAFLLAGIELWTSMTKN